MRELGVEDAHYSLFYMLLYCLDLLSQTHIDIVFLSKIVSNV